MWEPFTERARRSIHLSQEEANEMGSVYIGAEHLILGILVSGETPICEVLERHGLTADKVRELIRKERSEPSEGSSEMRFAPSFKSVLEHAFRGARNFGHNYVGSEHLVMGVLEYASKHKEGVLGHVLSTLKVNTQELMDEIVGISRPVVSTAPDASPSRRKTRSKTKTPTLDSYGRDLTRLATEGKLDPVVGRHDEIERLIMVLSRRTKSNPALVGNPGVGKTAIVEGLAQRIVRGEVPDKLAEKRVICVDLAGIVAGTRYRGEFEERLKKVMDEIRKASGEVIIFIDELHTLIGAGAAEGSMDAANILKPALARGEMQCIGSTTMGEYTKYIEKDPALERRFQPIEVKEPTPDEAIKILFGLRERYESFHGVKITDEAVREAVRLSQRYISDRFLPDKAIDVMDEASSRASLAHTAMPAELVDLAESMRRLTAEKETAIADQEYEKAAELREKFEKLSERKSCLEAERKAKRKEIGECKIVVDVDNIARVVSIWTGVPVSKLAAGEAERLLGIESYLHQRVIGQDEPVRVVSRAIKRARSGLKDPNRPIGSFLFLGPTGVGKTELARTLADFLFDDETAMVRVDMSEYMEKFSVSRLMGSPPGYVGYEEGGQLSDAVRRRPYSVVLFDEIEKAHPDVFNVLLHVMDEGHLTDAQKRDVDFRNAVIVLTSNIGFGDEDSSASLGFRGNREEGSAEIRYERMKKRVLEETKKVFKPEFLNRLDASVVFHALEKEHLMQIVDIMLGKVRKEMQNNKRGMQVTDAAKSVLVESCHEPQYGARPLRRAIQNILEDPLADEFLSGKFPEGSVILVDADPDDETRLSFSCLEGETVAEGENATASEGDGEAAT